MVVCAALVVGPNSSVFTPQELAGKLVALDYGNGTAYAGLSDAGGRHGAGVHHHLRRRRRMAATALPR